VFALLSSRYNSRRAYERGQGEKSRMKGERKGVRNQLSEDLRHVNKCRALFVTNYLLHRITSSQSRVNIHFFYSSRESILSRFLLI
jgi:hypothetical protein